MMQLSFTCKIKTTVLGFKIGLKVVQKSDETVYLNGPHRKVSLERFYALNNDAPFELLLGLEILSRKSH